mgnify:CR=1 FL=1
MPVIFLTGHADLLQALSSRRVVISERAGDGARTKLVNNLLAGINLVGAAEVLALADTTTPVGMRDRAMMEVLYATGMRRMELARLALGDIDAERGVVMIVEGKGGKDRRTLLPGTQFKALRHHLQTVRAMHQQDLAAGWPALMSILMIGFGITNISLGIIAEYLWRTLDASRKRQVYIIDEIKILKE